MPDKTFTSAALSSADVNTYLSHTGNGWITYTPTVTQGSAVTINSGLLIARYYRSGRKIEFSCFITISGTGTSSNTIVVSLPVVGATGIYGLGTGGVIDASASGTVYAATSVAATTSTAVIAWPSASNNPYLGSSGFTAALASGDVVYVSGSYEAAS